MWRVCGEARDMGNNIIGGGLSCEPQGLQHDSIVAAVSWARQGLPGQTGGGGGDGDGALHRPQ